MFWQSLHSRHTCPTSFWGLWGKHRTHSLLSGWGDKMHTEGNNQKFKKVGNSQYWQVQEREREAWAPLVREDCRGNEIELDVEGFRLDWREKHGTSGQHRLICKKTETSGRIKTSALCKHVYLLLDRDANKCPNSENPPVHSFVHPPTF